MTADFSSEFYDNELSEVLADEPLDNLEFEGSLGREPSEAHVGQAEKDSEAGVEQTHDDDDDAIDIEYEPDMDGDPDPGEVVWSWVPYEDDLSQGKDRPVVVIGTEEVDDIEYLVIVPLTTKNNDRDDELLLGAGPWDSKGRESYAKIDDLWRVLPVNIRREGAILDKPRFDRLISGVQKFHTDGLATQGVAGVEPSKD